MTNTAMDETVSSSISYWQQLMLGALVGTAAGTLYAIFAFNLLIFIEMDSPAEWFGEYLPVLTTSFFVALVGAPVGALVGLLTALLMAGVQRFSPPLWRQRAPLVGALAVLLICVPLQVLFMLAYDFSDRYAVESWVWKFGMWTLFAGVPTLLALWIGWWAAGVLRSRVNPIP